jgi:hypothetical protein
VGITTACEFANVQEGLIQTVTVPDHRYDYHNSHFNPLDLDCVWLTAIFAKSGCGNSNYADLFRGDGCLHFSLQLN